MFPKRAGLLAALAVNAAAQSSRNDPCYAAALQQSQTLESFRFAYDLDILYAPIDAKSAYDCVTSVPLNASDAVSMIDVVRTYFDFQTTGVFNANPPDSYQQPAIDVRERLDRLAQEAQDGAYGNQYDFDVALQSIVTGVHDGHYSLDMGVYGLFSWILPDSIVSVSSDGNAIPQVYALSDIQDEVSNASPIVELEGESVFTYLAKYVNRTGVPGYIEPHAEYNHINWAAASEFNTLVAYGFMISRTLDSFQQTRLYNGQSLSGRFANGTTFEWVYQAGAMMPLANQEYTSAEMILEEYVHTPRPRSSLNGRSVQSTYERRSTIPHIIPRNDVPVSVSETLRARASSSSGNTTLRIPSYPGNPDVVQRNFGLGGYVSGYILEDLSVGVLSIPSFQTGAGGLNDPGSSVSFSKAVRDFIQKARDAKVGKIVIDLSGNTGGTILQGIDTFKQLFPDAEPPLNVRGAATPVHNTLGRLLTGIVADDGSLFTNSSTSDLKSLGAFIALVNTDSTDHEGRRWRSYDDFFGPVEYNGGNFTNLVRYNLSDPSTTSAIGQNITGYGDNTVSYEAPWSGDDIVLLHDGSCASTCSIFSDLMKSHADVRSVVVGGVPQYGPMQAVSGTRGSNTLTVPSIDSIVQQILNLYFEEEDGFLALMESEGLTVADLNLLPTPLARAPWAVRNGAVNTLDIVRPESDDPGVPYQFAYEAAHCRLFYTAPMVRDISELWRVAAKYANGDNDVCVRDSTNGDGLEPNKIFVDSPGFDGAEVWANANSTNVAESNNSGNSGNGNGNGDDEGAASGIERSLAGLVVAITAVIMITM